MKKTTYFPLALLSLACLQASAAATTTTPPDAVTVGTAYTAFTADSYIELGEALDPMRMADMLMCVVSASGAPLLGNDTYQAVADFGLCGASDGAQTAQYSSMTVKSSRASSTAMQTADMWIHLKEDSAPVSDIHFKAQLTSGATATNHMGEWQLDWEFQNPNGANTFENGHMKATPTAGGFAEFIMANYNGEDANDTYAKISMSNATDGIAKVTTTNPAKSYAIAFNNTLVAIQESNNTATCQNIDTFTETVREYNLYDSNGALVDISAEIAFTTANGNQGILGSYNYWNGSAEVTAYWAWIDGDDYPTATTSTTVSDRETPTTKYTISWTVSGSGPSAYQTVTAVADGTSVGGAAHVFDKPIIFDVSSGAIATTINPLKERNDDSVSIATTNFNGNQLTYNGAGQLWGINWDNSANRNEVSLADGTALLSMASGNDIAHSGKTYYVKATSIASEPTTAADCSALSGSLASAKVLTLPTAADISNNSPTIGTEPTVTAKPKIKDGVLTD